MSSSNYSNAEMYTLATIVLEHPGEKHSTIKFWTTMLEKYGSDLFNGRTAEALRKKWRKFSGKCPNIEEYKEQLLSTLPESTINEINDKINSTHKALPKKTVASRLLKKEKPKPILLVRKEEDKKTIPDVVEEVERRVRYINLNELIPKESNNLLSVVEDSKKECKEYLEVDIPLYKRINNRFTNLSINYGSSLKYLIEVLEKVSGDFNELEKYLAGDEVVMWEKIEDLLLKNDQSEEVRNYLIQEKKLENVNKRKKFLEPSNAPVQINPI